MNKLLLLIDCFCVDLVLCIAVLAIILNKPLHNIILSDSFM